MEDTVNKTDRPYKKNRKPYRMHLLAVSAILATIAACGGGSGGGSATTTPSGNSGGTPPVDSSAPVVQVLSSRPEFASGGSALVDIALPTKASGTPALAVTVNGGDATSAFQPDPARSGHMIGLVTGLKDGVNVLNATYGTSTTFSLTNHPITGPIVSGPRVSPFVCQTQGFVLPDGSTFGAATDADCSAPTRIAYLYRSTSGAMKTLPSTTALPSDMATTSANGKNEPFIVRIETATIDRGIYQSAILFDPTKEGTPNPVMPPQAWNKRLIALQGTGCAGGWYVQGSSQGVDLLAGDNLARLAEGYGLYTSTLNHPSNNCNAFLAGESAMMGKEHFIKTYGVPLYTVGVGTSGGSYFALQIADAFPGVLDGVFVDETFPDTLTLTVAALDARLLSHYLLANNDANFTEAQMTAVSGHKSARAWYDLALQSGRADPVPNRSDPIPASSTLGGYQSAVWNAAVPESLRYDPAANPRGARPTVFDIARNIYGTDASGFALWPYDNTGVQYGLDALNGGVITTAQFLDLNERIGGYDRDANYIGTRNAADANAIKRAYQSGMLLGGSGGLAAIPVFDLTGMYDEDGGYHYQWFHFAVRERLAQANGDARNHVMWRGMPSTTSGAQYVRGQAWGVFTQWMDAIAADGSTQSQRDKVIASKPATATDGCFARSTTPQFIAETQTWSNASNTQCNALWPSYSFPRKGAGAELAASKLKCQLKPLNRSDYAVSFTDSEFARLGAIFPNGVCDWSRPGVNQTVTVPYAAF
jgi:hypothetical protein